MWPRRMAASPPASDPARPGLHPSAPPSCRPPVFSLSEWHYHPPGHQVRSLGLLPAPSPLPFTAPVIHLQVLGPLPSVSLGRIPFSLPTTSAKAPAASAWAGVCISLGLVPCLQSLPLTQAVSHSESQVASRYSVSAPLQPFPSQSPTPAHCLWSQGSIFLSANLTASPPGTCHALSSRLHLALCVQVLSILCFLGLKHPSL